MSITIEEKLALGRELGLDGMVAFEEAQREAAQLTSLSFRPIDAQGIRAELLRNIKRHPVSRRWLLGQVVVDSLRGMLIGLLIGGFLGMLISIVAEMFQWPLAVETIFFWSMEGLGVLGGVAAGISAWCDAPFSFDVKAALLETWQNALPYGALLAVKEAKAMRCTNFVIHSPLQVRHDPVITASTPKGNTIMVYSWDVGLIEREARGA